MGGFSIAYDLVSSEYGWTDEQIGALPIARFRQVVAAIQLRRYENARAENLRASWMVRTLSQFIAGGYMTEKGKPNEALEGAQKLSYDEIEKEILKDGPPPPPIEEANGNGSFERLMMVMGQGQMLQR